MTVERIHPLPSSITHVDETDFPEHPQVLGHQRLPQAEQPDQVVYRPFPGREDVQDLPPPGLGHRVERIRCGGCSCHAKHYIPIWEYVKAEMGKETIPRRGR